MIEHFDWTTWAAIIGSFVAIAGLLAKVIFNLRSDMEAKITRVYQRVDDCKTYFDNTHTRKDICQIRHEQVEKKLDEVAADVKTILRKINFNGNKES